MLFFASHIADMKRTVSRMVGVHYCLTLVKSVYPGHHSSGLEKAYHVHSCLPNDAASQTHSSPVPTSFSAPFYLGSLTHKQTARGKWYMCSNGQFL